MDETQEPMEDEERKEPRRDSGELGVQQLLGSVLDRGRVRNGFCQAGLNLRDSAVRPAGEEVMEVKRRAGSVAVDNASDDRATDPAGGRQEAMKRGQIMTALGVEGGAGSAAVDNASSDRATDPAEEDGQESTEARIMKGQKKVVSPGRQEWDDHMRTHIPYRKWCPIV